jgi:hypothetical protein
MPLTIVRLKVPLEENVDVAPHHYHIYLQSGGHRKCASPNSNFHDGFVKVLLCLVKSPGDNSIDNGGDFGLMGFVLFNNLFQK